MLFSQCLFLACGMPPLCPHNWGGGHNANLGGTLKQFCIPNFKIVSAPSYDNNIDLLSRNYCQGGLTTSRAAISDMNTEIMSSEAQRNRTRDKRSYYPQDL